jgi:hypothetical protein
MRGCLAPRLLSAIAHCRMPIAYSPFALPLPARYPHSPLVWASSLRSVFRWSALGRLAFFETRSLRINTYG